MIRTPAAISLALAALAFAIFLAASAYPWQLAVLAATAIGALVYSTQITWDRMRRLYRPPDASDLAIRRAPAEVVETSAGGVTIAANDQPAAGKND